MAQLSLLLLAACVFGSCAEESFYSFRPVSDPVTLTMPIPYYGHLVTKLTLSHHGLISLNGVNAQDTPQPLPFLTSPEAEGKVLAVFWTKHRATANLITYEQSTDPDALDQVNQDVASYFSCESDFEATWLFRAKWHHAQSLPEDFVYDYDICSFAVGYAVYFYEHLPSSSYVTIVADYFAWFCSNEPSNTYEVTIASDGSKTFLFYKYERIEWGAGDGQPWAECGFNHGDGVQSVSLTGSGTPQVMQLTAASNVADPGVFAYRVDSAGMETPCEPENPDQTCACHVTDRIVTFDNTEFLPVSEFQTKRLVLARSDANDNCRFRLVVVVSSLDGKYFLRSVGLFFGHSPTKAEGYGLRIKFRRNKAKVVYLNGVEDFLDLNSPFEYTDPAGQVPDIQVSQVGGAYILESPSCGWSLRYYSADNSMIFFPGDHTIDGGLCGDCD